MLSPGFPFFARRWVVRLLTITIGTYVALCGLLMFFENSLVFHPTPADHHWACAAVARRARHHPDHGRG